MSNCYANDFTTTVKKYYKEIKECNPITREEEKELIHLAKNGDLSARNKVLTSNLKFVFDVAKSYKGQGIPMEELIAEGNMGLVHAFDKYDESKDVKFISYAVWWIRWHIQDAISRKREIIEKEVYNDEITPNTDNKDKQNKEIVDSDNNEITLVINNIESTENFEKTTEHKDLVRHLLTKLDKRERIIIEYYFGFKTGIPMTLEECSDTLKMSKERIRQIKEKSLLKLRSEMLVIS